MFFKFLPKETSFFDLFDRQVGYAVEAASYFKELVRKESVTEALLEKINIIEHRGDEVAHEIFQHLNTTFITPFDREDIHGLAKELDNIADMIDSMSNRLMIYKLNPNNNKLAEFASLIEKSVGSLERAVKGLRNIKDSKLIHESCIEVNRLENLGDSLRDSVLAELFEKNHDAISVMKWKEIYQDAETVLDICEDITHVVESILVKQA